jgi:hypothetical protein
MVTQAEQIFLNAWFDVWAPQERRVIVYADAISQETHPVLVLEKVRTSVREPQCFIMTRPTKWGAWLRGFTTLSSATCRLLLEAAGYEVIAHEYGMLTRNNSGLFKAITAGLKKVPLLRQLCQYELIILRSRSINMVNEKAPSVSVIIPCRNEAGTIEDMICRMPRLGSFTEIICVEGHSRDNTLAELCRVQEEHPQINMRVVVQSGKGKKNAVVEGCDSARGDIIIIFDSDMTVLPEDMEAFYHALVSRCGDIINGSRLLFHLPCNAMRWPNFIANHLFALVVSYTGILGQRVTDTLCGTKVCWRRDYVLSRTIHKWLWDCDPFGDFAWLFGIAMLGGKIQDLPVRYYARTYGAPIVGSFGYGVQLLKVLWKIFVFRCMR